MKLPTLDVYEFPITIPSNGKTIKIRPYLVREEKLLLMAQESNDYREQVEAIAQVIRNCTNNEVEPNTAPYFDIEYLLINLRARSVGEISSPVYICKKTNPVTNVECGQKKEFNINLTEIGVSNNTLTPDDFIISINEQYKLVLRYPTVFTINNLLIGLSSQKKSKSIDALADLFLELLDIKENISYKFDTYTETERIEFLNSLAPNIYEKLTQFVSKMPSVEYINNYICDGCGAEHELRLRGMSDFLA